MRGLLFSQMDPPLELEAEFHDWYDNVHIPIRLALPGFGWAVRYRATEDATRYLVCYFIDDLAVLDTAAYEEINRAPSERTEQMLGAVRDFTRFTCELVADTSTGPPADASRGDLTLVHAMLARAGSEFELEQAYQHDVDRFIAADAGRTRVQLYRVFGGSVGGAWTHFALHDVAEGSTDRFALTHPTADGTGATTGPPPVVEQAWWEYRAFHRAGPPPPTGKNVA